MKKGLALFLSLVLLVSAVFASFAFAEETAESTPPPLPPFVRENTKVVSVFAAGLAQPLQRADSEQEMIDTIWIYYDNGTFVQFAQIDHQFDYFSEGTYSFGNGGSFFIDESTKNGTITINRAKKHSTMEGRITEYVSSHEYVLGTLGFRQLYGPTVDKEVEAIFCDPFGLPYTDESSVTWHLDVFLLFYNDGSFEAFAVTGKDVINAFSGTYAFDEIGDFAIPHFEKESGKLTLNITESINENIKKTITYDFGSMGIMPLFEKKVDVVK